MRSIESIIMTCSAAAGTASLLLLVFAWRGRRIDDHPICRKCGFDLFGLPSTSTRCPECGRDLARRRATRRGHRRKRVRLIAIAAIVLTAALVPLSVPVVIRARGLKWTEQEPLSWLVRNARNSPSAGTRDLALDEILRRLNAGKLSTEQVNELVEVALAHQADRSHPWQVRWGLFVEAAETRGQLGAAAWERYRAQAADRYELEVRDVVRPGFAFPVRVRLLPERVGTPGRFAYFPQMAYHIDGQLLLPMTELANGDASDSSDSWDRGYLDLLLPFPPQEVIKLEPGSHQAGVTLTVTVRDDRWKLLSLGSSGKGRSNSQGFLSRARVRRASVPPISLQDLQKLDELEQADRGTLRETRLLKPFTLVREDHPRVELIHDDAKAAAVRAAVGAFVNRAGGTRLAVEFRGNEPPVDLACAARLIWKDASYDLGAVVLRAGIKERFTSSVDLGPDLREVPERVDIVLTPDPLAAEYTVDIKRIWADVIFLKDVRVAGP